MMVNDRQLTNVVYTDLKPNTPYRVVAGENDDFSAGDLFWVDGRDGSVVVLDKNAGWLDKADIPSSLFSGLTIEAAMDYVVQTNARVGGYSTLRRRV